jgi:hypothetical protein
MRYELRIETWDQAFAKNSLFDLPIVHIGDKASCEQYAKDNGYVWCAQKNFLCCGYWYNAETRTTLYPMPLLNTDN